MLVVCDSGPLIYLGATGYLWLLRELYGEILSPPEVMHEVTVAGAGEPGAAEVAACAFLRIERIAGEDAVWSTLSRELDAGEAATLALARALRADLVLMDERKGRLIARSLGLRVRGTLGVVLEAKRAGRLPSVQAALQALRAAGLWMSDELVKETLALAGEGPEQTP